MSESVTKKLLEDALGATEAYLQEIGRPLAIDLPPALKDDVRVRLSAHALRILVTHYSDRINSLLIHGSELDIILRPVTGELAMSFYEDRDPRHPEVIAALTVFRDKL